MTPPIRRRLTGVALFAVATIVGVGCADDPATSPTPTPSVDATTGSEPTGDPSAGPSAPTSESTAPPPTDSDAPQPEAAPEVRAIWIHLFDDTLKTRASIDATIDRAAEANINTLFVEVVRRQDAYYDSAVLPRTNDPSLEPGLDVLGRVLSRAHEHGMVVHAWYPILQTYHHRAYEGVPAPQGWVWTEHGPDAPVDQRWVTRKFDGTWAEYLDPALPQVRDYVTRAIADIAAHYPVDGIHLDYPRYDGVEYGFHPDAVARYRSETGAASPTDPADAAFSAWRRDQVTSLVREIRAAIHEVTPELPLSAAVIAQRDGPSANRPFSRTRPYAEYFQDWAGWVEEGLLDIAVPMNYFEDAIYGDWFNEWVAFESTLAAQHDTLIVGGQGSWLNPMPASLDQLERLRNAGLDGVSLYSFQQTQADGDPQGLLDVLGGGTWSDPAPVPDGLRGP